MLFVANMEYTFRGTVARRHWSPITRGRKGTHRLLGIVVLLAPPGYGVCMATCAVRMRTCGLALSKVDALAGDFIFVDDANSDVVVIELNDSGACNDKTMVKTDPFITSIATDGIYLDFMYKVIVDENNLTLNMRGAFAINDGGYHHWVHTIAGTKEAHAATIHEKRWAGTMESIRKESEWCFGIMKKCLLHSSYSIIATHGI